MIRRLSAAVVALLLFGTLGACGGSEAPTKAKDRLPDVTLPGLGGAQPVDLGSLRGPVVVNLWASWCEPCKRELPLYAAFAKKYDGKVRVLGVDFQETSTTEALAMMRTADVTYPVVADQDGDLRPIGLPKLVLVDADGEITYSEYVEIKSASQLETIVRDHLGVAG